jgi:hypothetical protein
MLPGGSSNGGQGETLTAEPQSNARSCAALRRAEGLQAVPASGILAAGLRVSEPPTVSPQGHGRPAQRLVAGGIPQRQMRGLHLSSAGVNSMYGNQSRRMGLVLALLCCAGGDAKAQRWEYIGETPAGEWFIDAESTSVVAEAVVHAWVQLKMRKEIEGPNGAWIKYVRMMSRYHCAERWSLSLASEARTAGDFPVDAKSYPPDPSRRSYPSPGSMSMEVLQAACQFWKR